MANAVLTQIESEFAQLPPKAQLTLLERLARRARVTAEGSDAWEADLAAMAADPKMQSELRRINAEFDVTEADGLGRP